MLINVMLIKKHVDERLIDPYIEVFLNSFCFEFKHRKVLNLV